MKRRINREIINDALSGPEGFERQFESHVTKEWLDKNKGTSIEAVRRNTFRNLVNYCKDQPEYR